MSEMFCFQCEQTARGTGGIGCHYKSGICGKKAATALLQDELTGALIGLARAAETKTPPSAVTKVLLDGLFTTVTNVNFDDAAIKTQIMLVRDAAASLGGLQQNEYAVAQVWNNADENIRSLKSLLLFGMRGMAAYAHHALTLGYSDSAVDDFFYKGLRAVGDDTLSVNELLPLVLECGQANLKCMELLDKANTETYGNPEPTTVELKVEPGPFIVITGHDLHDLKLLLDQTEGKGVNIYTHGEMLPVHAYPKLKTYKHFKGNFGTAWQNQQKEFADIPAPVLFTTNCIMPVQDSYKDRIYTTAVVGYPDMVHIGEGKDFGPVIKKALELGGYKETQNFTGINGGKEVTTGFGHHTVLGVADTVVEAVKAGALKHIFLVGGCDGAKPGRNYYTEFVQQTPPDTLVLTLACGKYRFNDLNVGELGGLPRILDMGQCNDAYSAIKVAVAILLTLLSLGLKNMYIGPSLPAFVSALALKAWDTFKMCSFSALKTKLRCRRPVLKPKPPANDKGPSFFFRNNF